MAGIYIHIPFCKQHCHYCDFYFVTSLKHKAPFLEALHQEIILTADYLEKVGIDSIYFGGGTPSLLETSEINQILDWLSKHYSIASEAEITLEANPDDLTLQKLQALKSSEVNRLSIGVQSFFDEDLQWMNRAHNAQEAKQCILNAKMQGFQSLTIDLIYGMPTLLDNNWEQNITTTIELGIPHISAYALTVEPKTPLSRMIAQGAMPQVQDEVAQRHFVKLMEVMQASGYEHYEISNFSLPGQQAIHNSNYWKQVPYLGLGPSAHSYNGTDRRWNVRHVLHYIQSVLAGDLPAQKEILSDHDQFNEYVMTGLRTSWGISKATIEDKFGKKVYHQFLTELKPWIVEGMVQEQGRGITLTQSGKLIADRIAASLFQVEE